MSDLSRQSPAARLGQSIADLRERGHALWRRVVCRLIGCRWGFWLPTEFRLRGRDEPLDKTSVFESAVRQCTRCRILQNGPAYIPYESRDVQ